MNDIHESLIEMSREMGPQEIRQLLQVPELLVFFYKKQKETRDRENKELQEFLKGEIEKLQAGQAHQ